MLVTERTCDVSKNRTTVGVETFKVLLLKMPEDIAGTPAAEFENALPSLPGVEIEMERDIDLCPRSLKRLAKFLVTGTSKAGKQNTASSEGS